MELAKKVGVHPCHISLIESGERRPSARVLHALCEALELTPEERLEALRLAAGAGEASDDAA